MLKVLCAEFSPLCHGESLKCAWLSAMPDGYYVLKNTCLHLKYKAANSIVLDFFSFFFNLTYTRWTSSLPSCLRSLTIFPSLPGSRLTTFYRDASSVILQVVNQWLNFTYSCSHAFRYERKNTNPILVRIELTTSVLAGVQVTYETTRAARTTSRIWPYTIP